MVKEKVRDPRGEDGGAKGARAEEEVGRKRNGLGRVR